MRSWGASALVVGLLLLAAEPAMGQQAKRCGEHGSPWIRLRTEGLSREFQTLLMTQVRSSLAARQIDVCVFDEPSASAPLATLEVMMANAEVATSIVVNDGITHKRVSRDLDVRSVPPDSRALTIALALDELLRASWAELLLPDAEPRTPPPSVVTEAIVPRGKVPRWSRKLPASAWEIGAAFGGEHFSEGHDQLGADVGASYFPWSRLGFDARLGLRFGSPVHAPRGEIRSTALAMRLGPAFAVVPRTGRAGLDLLGEVLLTRVTFVAEPTAMGIRGNEKTAVASYVVTGMRGWLVVLPQVRAFFRVGGGVPMHTVYATDGDVRVTGLAGFLVTGDVGASVVF